MKEFSELPKSVGEIIKKHFPISKTYRPVKRWLIAQNRGKQTLTVMRNSSTEAAYHRIINTVKTLYLKSDEVFFERNYKIEETENFLSMHCLMTSTFYLYLECDFCYEFQIEYAFDNCPFESEIMAMLRVFPLDTQAKQRELQPNFKGFYATVLRVQEPQFIHSFKR